MLLREREPANTGLCLLGLLCLIINSIVNREGSHREVPVTVLSSKPCCTNTSYIKTVDINCIQTRDVTHKSHDSIRTSVFKSQFCMFFGTAVFIIIFYLFNNWILI